MLGGVYKARKINITKIKKIKTKIKIVETRMEKSSW